jgi:hypothetical protein
MTRAEMEEIYEFVLRSGLAPDLVYKVGDKYSDRFENFRSFAFFVAEKEREECAKICENSVEYAGDTLAKAIRARGKR